VDNNLVAPRHVPARIGGYRRRPSFVSMTVPMGKRNAAGELHRETGVAHWPRRGPLGAVGFLLCSEGPK
jgi:hypothetical protein